MYMPVLHDAVTLRHFATARRLDILEARHGSLPGPRWTEAVFGEIWAANELGHEGCFAVLEQRWLGSWQGPTDSTEQLAIQRLRIKLGGSVVDLAHAGEAESIFFAEKLNGALATDDGPAYAFAVRRLGAERVVDTVDILRTAVSLDEISAAEAVAVCDAIRSNGRHLRPTHPDDIGDDYFD